MTTMSPATSQEARLRPRGVEVPPHGLAPAKIAALDGMTVPTCTTS